jgi:hypothetical protein
VMVRAFIPHLASVEQHYPLITLCRSYPDFDVSNRFLAGHQTREPHLEIGLVESAAAYFSEWLAYGRSRGDVKEFAKRAVAGHDPQAVIEYDERFADCVDNAFGIGLRRSRGLFSTLQSGNLGERDHNTINLFISG